MTELEKLVKSSNPRSDSKAKITFELPLKAFHTLKDIVDENLHGLAMQEISLRDALQNSVLSKDQIENINNFLTGQVMPKVVVLSEMKRACDEAVEQIDLTI